MPANEKHLVAITLYGRSPVTTIALPNIPLLIFARFIAFCKKKRMGTIPSLKTGIPEFILAMHKKWRHMAPLNLSTPPAALLSCRSSLLGA